MYCKAEADWFDQSRRLHVPSCLVPFLLVVVEVLWCDTVKYSLEGGLFRPHDAFCDEVPFRLGRQVPMTRSMQSRWPNDVVNPNRSEISGDRTG